MKSPPPPSPATHVHSRRCAQFQAPGYPLNTIRGSDTMEKSTSITICEIKCTRPLFALRNHLKACRSSCVNTSDVTSQYLFTVYMTLFLYIVPNLCNSDLNAYDKTRFSYLFITYTKQDNNKQLTTENNVKRKILEKKYRILIVIIIKL